MPPTLQNCSGAVGAGAPDDEYHPAFGEEDADDSGFSSDGESMTFKVRDKLPAAQVKRWPVRELVELLGSPWLDLDAEYQRDVVWTSKGMSGLINSLLEDYYIPPIIFNLEITRDENGNERHRRVCVDGKQRLSSIYAFVLGKCPVHDRRGRPWYFIEQRDEKGERVRAKTDRVLPDSIRDSFMSKTLICVELPHLTADQEEELFARVQKGVALSAAEKLKATTGPWQTLARQFESEYPTVTSLVDNKRAKGFQLLLSSFAQIIECLDPTGADERPTVKVSAAAVERFLSKARDRCTEENKSHLHRVFGIFRLVVAKSPNVFGNNNYRNAKKFAPSEMILISVLISQYMDSRNEALLAGDIAHMRSSIRQVLPDLRMDSTTWKTAWQYIENLEGYRESTSGNGVAKPAMLGLGRRALANFQSRPQAVDTAHRRQSSSSTTQHENSPKTPAPTGEPVQPSIVPAEDSQVQARRQSLYPPHPAPLADPVKVIIKREEDISLRPAAYRPDPTMVHRPPAVSKRPRPDDDDHSSTRQINERVRRMLEDRRKRQAAAQTLQSKSFGSSHDS